MTIPMRTDHEMASTNRSSSPYATQASSMSAADRSQVLDNGDDCLSMQRNCKNITDSSFMSTAKYSLFHGDALHVLQSMPPAAVDCVMTSPPYYGQRDYGVNNQLGLEAHPQQYIDKLVAVFHELHRVLKPTGSLWVNIGDTYWSGKGTPTRPDRKQPHRRFARPQDQTGQRPWCTPKQLLLIPHRFAISMQEDGWIVRNDNVWYKPTAMPDPVDDRCASSHEYVFHFVQRRRYYFDAAAIAVPSGGNRPTKTPPSVWMIQTEPSAKRHAAVFPPALVTKPVLATLPPGGTFLDLFCGSGTSLAVALSLDPQCQVWGVDASQDAIGEATLLLTDVAG